MISHVDGVSLAAFEHLADVAAADGGLNDILDVLDGEAVSCDGCPLAARLNLGDSIDFLGWRQDVPDILRAADVMVLPSLAELPLAVLEAMACGIPVVATRVNGTPEAVPDVETGFLVQPNDPQTLAQKVLIPLTDRDLRTRMGMASRQRVERCFTLPGFLSRMEALYDDLLKH